MRCRSRELRPSADDDVAVERGAVGASDGGRVVAADHVVDQVVAVQDDTDPLTCLQQEAV